MNLSTARAMFLASFDRVIGQGGYLKSFVRIYSIHSARALLGVAGDRTCRDQFPYPGH